MVMKHWLIAGLLCGLAGGSATAQMSPTPNDPNQQQPDVSTPGAPPTFPSDTQDTTREQRTNRDADADHPQMDREGQAQPRSDRDYDRDRNTGSIGSNAGQQDRNQDTDPDHRSDYESQLQTALQQNPNLKGVQVKYTDTTVELTGTVPTGKEKHEARMMAQDYANGRKVVDHITVTGKGQ